jgi:hypothetical protein
MPRPVNPHPDLADDADSWWLTNMGGSRNVKGCVPPKTAAPANVAAAEARSVPQRLAGSVSAGGPVTPHQGPGSVASSEMSTSPTPEGLEGELCSI